MTVTDIIAQNIVVSEIIISIQKYRMISLVPTVAMLFGVLFHY